MLCPNTAFIWTTLALIIGRCACDDLTQQSIDDLIVDIFNTSDDDAILIHYHDFDPRLPPVINPVPTTPTFWPEATKTTVLNPSDSYKSCGYEKECVPRFLCQDDSINTDGTNIIDIRGVDGHDGGECTYLEVCCDINNKRDTPVINPVAPETHVGCGYRNPDGIGFRITGNVDEAEFGEFPWMVAILHQEEAPDEILSFYQCGGALIAPNVVVTGAQSVSNRKAPELIVRAGEWDTQSKDEILPTQDMDVREIIIHEHYNKGALFNDVALLILDGDFAWAENIRPVCLPPSNFNFDRSRCFATGWGKDKFGKDGQYQVILKKIELPIMPRDTCQNNLRRTRLGKYFNLHDSFICAGGEKGKDTCKGDGGSPLVCPVPGVKNRFYHAGIVAWGIGCGEENIPGVYGSISYLRPWIESKLKLVGVNFQHFTP